jgi:hypothetical protein
MDTCENMPAEMMCSMLQTPTEAELLKAAQHRVYLLESLLKEVFHACGKRTRNRIMDILLERLS